MLSNELGEDIAVSECEIDYSTKYFGLPEE